MSRYLIVVATVAALLAPVGTATGQETTVDHVVQAGAKHPSNPLASYEFTRYYPERLQVHRGQTVQWDWMGFHSVSFFPGGASDRQALLRPDEVPGTYALTEGWAFHTGCGRDGLPACTLDGTPRLISSGPPTLDTSSFRVKVDVPEGTYSYFCTVHPSMRGDLEVVDDAQPLRDQAEIDAERTEQIAADAAAADELVEAGQTPVSTIENGQRVWTVRLGDSTPDNHVAILQYLPGHMNVEPGDAIRYVYRPGIVDEIHTVTFPAAATGGFSPAPHGMAGLGFHPVCDLDDRTSGMKGIPGPWLPGVLDCPVNLEMGVAPWMVNQTRAPLDAVVSPSTVHDSAILAPVDQPEAERGLPPGSGNYFPTTFDASFPVPGEFEYACNIHGGAMSGTVTVG